MKRTVENRRYGLLSLMALIVGSVIGSGIFFKNDSVNAATRSGFISLVGWLIIASVVMMVAVAMLELFSAKTKTRRAGVAGISSSFISPKWGKFIGFFFVYAYFPTSLAAAAVYAGTLFMDALQGAMGDMSAMANPWINLGITTAIGVTIVLFVGLINTFTERPGTIFQTIGVTAQITTLMSITVLVIVLMIVPTNFISTMPDGVIADPNYGASPSTPIIDIPFYPTSGIPNWADFGSSVNGGKLLGADGSYETYGLEGSGSSIANVLILALPPIMFTFDGFLFASSLQSEAKSRKTFPVALVAGIIIISILYLMIAIGTIETASVPPEFNLGAFQSISGPGEVIIESTNGVFYKVNITAEQYNTIKLATDPVISGTDKFVLAQHFEWWEMGGVSGLIARLMPKQSKWLPDTVSFVIVISALTTVSGFFITSARDMAIISSEDLIADPQGKYLRRNKAGVPQASSFIVLWMTVGWLIVARSLDLIFIADQIFGWTQAAVVAEKVDLTHSTDFVANFIVVLAFVTYVLPLIGGIVNRYTGKIEVEKNVFYIPFAVISTIFIILISLTNIVNVLASVAGHYMEFINVLLLIATIALPAFLNWKAGIRVRKTTASQWKTKELYKQAYFALQTVEEYEATRLSAPHTTEIDIRQINKKIKEKAAQTATSKTTASTPKKTQHKEKPKAKEVDYNTLKVAELRKLAKDKNIKGYSTMKKADLIKNIKKVK